MGRFLGPHRDVLPALFRAMDHGRFAFSMAVVTIAALLIVIAGTRGRKDGPWLVAAVALQIPVLGLNGLQHAVAAVWTGGYTPGVISGLLLGVPFCAVIVRRAFRNRWVPVGPTLLAALGETVFLAGLITASHLLGIRLL